MLLLLGTIFAFFISIFFFKFKGDFEADLLAGMLIFVVAGVTFISLNIVDGILSNRLPYEVVTTQHELVPYKNGKIVKISYIKGVSYEYVKLDNGTETGSDISIYLDENTTDSYVIRKHKKMLKKSRWLVYDVDTYQYEVYLNERDYEQMVKDKN